MTTTGSEPTEHREDGSLPLVLLAAIVFAGITVALFVDVSTGQRTARSDRDFNQAIQVADAGMQSAFTTLADLDPDTVGVPLGASTAPASVTVEDGTATWTATRVGRSRWQVRAEGRFEDTTRVLEATIGPRQLFELAAFADLKLELRGGNLADSYDGVTVDPKSTGNGAVGSNHEIVLRGNATVDWIKRYNNATYGEKGIVLKGVESTADPVELPNKAEEAYADGGVCAGTTPVAWTGQFPLVRGETYCFTAMIVPAGDHRLADPAAPTTEPTRIYLAPSGNLELKGQGNHKDDCDKAACLNNWPRLVPRATDLEIYLASGEVLANNHTVIAAGIYAPTSNCSGPNAQGHVYGAIVCRTLDSKGSWSFHYDDRFLEVETEEFSIDGLREETLTSTSFG